ncbi:hypothetical protein CE91St30_01120 [Raoultibacter timonensis]|uniref:Uncharacterized protein n=1 Tax=Raoultibacter timonensis TaxID=1907662 RepID=A0ABN6MB28_9ACTN|nr:hypothetical protein CE91St30_01120 [Raoultibacter timonensis]BDF49382.1 hypothetical protein CE91St31_01120 [Raoultibacter timonensis]
MTKATIALQANVNAMGNREVLSPRTDFVRRAAERAFVVARLAGETCLAATGDTVVVLVVG